MDSETISSTAMKKRTNFEVKIISARLGCAKDKLAEDPNYMFRIHFVRKNAMKKTEERLKTNKVELKDSLMYFNDERIFFSDIDYANDILEISLSLINDKERAFRSSIFRIKDLALGKEKDDIWTLNMQSLINLKYHIYTELVKDIMSELNLKLFSETENQIPDDRENCKIQKQMNNNQNLQQTKHNVKKIVSFEKLPNNDTALNEKQFTPITNASTSFLLNNSPNKNSKKTEKKIAVNGTNLNMGILNTNLNLNFQREPSKRFSIQSNESDNLNMPNLNKVSFENLDDLNLDKMNSNLSLKMKSQSRSTYFNDNMNFSGDIIDYELIDTSNSNKDLSLFKNYYDTFCEAFFVSGLPSTNVQTISNWETLKSPCLHKDCSLLPAYKPEILYKFQKKTEGKNDFDITNIASSLCFPCGIKICYSHDRQNVSHMNSFMNVITNHNGERFYMLNYFYYKIVEYSQFQQQYNFDPIREYLKKITDPTFGEKKIEKELQVCSNFMNTQLKYIPECITLISKHPFNKQLEKCLEAIFKLVCTNNKSDSKITKFNFNPSEEIGKLISHLVNEVPIPQNNKKLLFYIPFNQVPIELTGIYMKELPILNYPLTTIINEISIENIILIFQLIVLEQKILFVHDDYSKLSGITQGFLSLIYPFNWVNTYVPVLSHDLIKYLESFIPFIMGLDENLLNVSYKSKYIYPDENNKIFIVNLNKKYISVSTAKKEKKLTKKTLGKEGVPDLPQEVLDMLTSELKELRKVLDDPKNRNNVNSEKFDSIIREIFIKAMVMMVGDYQKFSVTDPGDSFPTFKMDKFLINRPKTYQKFYQEVTQTQLFKEFLNCDKNSNNLTSSNNTFFEKMCRKHIGLINFSGKRSTSKFEKRSSSVSHSESMIESNSSKGINNNLETRRNSFINSLTPNIATYKYQYAQTETNAVNNSDINSSKSGQYSFTNENTACNTKDLSDYVLLSPYFLNDPISKFDCSKIEERMAAKFPCEDLNEDILVNRLIDGNFPIPEDKVFNLIRRYYFTTTNRDNKDNSEPQNMTQSLPSMNLGKTKTYSSSEDFTREFILEPDQSNIQLIRNKANSVVFNNKHEISSITDTIKKPINECLKCVFSETDSLSPVQQEFMKKRLALHHGRIYFANMIICQENNRSKNLYSLSEANFSLLSKFILTALSHAENNVSEHREIRLITKATFSYYKVLKNKNGIYYIYEEIVKHYTHPAWVNEDFWLKWFELEMEEEKGNNIFPNIEDFYFTILLKLGNYMSQLGIKLDKVKGCLLDKVAHKFFKKSKDSVILIKELEDSLDKLGLNQ